MYLPEFPELTPAMRGVLERMSRARRPALHGLPPAAARAAYDAGADVLEVPRAPLARREDFSITAPDGFELPARLYQPTEAVLPVLLYFHGGGFTVGSIRSHDILCSQLACLSGCAVVSLDYRLAPEHRFPTAVEDAWTALQWLSQQAYLLGLDGERIAVGGDSAGGTLATVSAIRARDAGLPLLLQLLFYPGCAGRPLHPSHARYGRGMVLEQAHIEYFFSQYIDDALRDDWRFAPLKAVDVSGVAPAWMGLAQCDPIVDDALAYADKLRAAGVAVELVTYAGVTHEFIKMGRVLPEARQAHADAAAALRKALAP